MQYGVMSFIQDAEAKLVVLGPSKVGKTALTVRLLTKRFIGEYQPNTESVHNHSADINGEKMGVVIRDTCIFTKDGKLDTKHSGLSWGDAYAVVYSVTDRESFDAAIEIVETIYDIKGTDEVNVALIGNKKDLEHFREVSEDDSRAAAEQLGCLRYEVSASDDFDNVQKVFQMLFVKIRNSNIFTLQTKEVKNIPDTNSLNATNAPKKIVAFNPIHPKRSMAIHMFGNALSKLKQDKKKMNGRRAETV